MTPREIFRDNEKTNYPASYNATGSQLSGDDSSTQFRDDLHCGDQNLQVKIRKKKKTKKKENCITIANSKLKKKKKKRSISTEKIRKYSQRFLSEICRNLPKFSVSLKSDSESTTVQ
ncbi:hypothetical protein ANTPLA_LOCUS1117 [Anthophora plagiata]